MKKNIIILAFYMLASTTALAGFNEGITAYTAGDYQNAMKEWLPLAKKGNPDAQRNVGMMYKFGEGVKKDLKKAFDWYSKAADQGDAQSQFSLGVAYLEGAGTKKNENAAASWLKKSADQGNMNAEAYLGYIYKNGIAVEKNSTEAVQWYLKASEKGHDGAQMLLGRMYYSGDGVQKDFSESISWSRKAAEQGNQFAQADLGDRYYSGEGVQKDLKAAAEWFSKSAEQGNSYAQYSLGFMYNRGQGVQKNESTAMVFLRKASEQGNKSAKEEIARIEAMHLQAEQENAARQLREENERKRVTQVGQKICTSIDNTQLSKPTGLVVMGQSVYQEYNGRTNLVGFVEGSSGNKIQIRISGMTFMGSINKQNRMGYRMPENISESMDSFTGYKGSNLRSGGIIWDDYFDWYACY